MALSTSLLALDFGLCSGSCKGVMDLGAPLPSLGASLHPFAGAPAAATRLDFGNKSTPLGLELESPRLQCACASKALKAPVGGALKAFWKKHDGTCAASVNGAPAFSANDAEGALGDLHTLRHP